MSPNIMTLSDIVCVVGLLIISTTIVAYDGIQIEDGSHGDPVTTDRLPEEPHLLHWSVQPASPPGCPEQCSCKKNDVYQIIDVNCSSRGLTTVPDLPQTTVVLSLEKNSISNISCDSLKHLRGLKDLNIASNNISHLPPCVFQSQSGSLLNLSVSNNSIDSLDAKLFRDLSQLKKLNLSFNTIPYLANRTFSDLAQLINLDLSFNFIDGIAPDAFKGLRSLKTLSLRSNQLDSNSSFHRDVFKDLVALETLDTKGNSGILDNAISSLRNLSRVYMDFVSQAEIGPGFRHLINLRVLDIGYVIFKSGGGYKSSSSCGIVSSISSHFFDNIQTVKSLELYMSNCKIFVIKNDTFSGLRTLVTLDLSGNHFIDFQDCSQGWTASLINSTITSLDLSYTTMYHKMRELTDCLFQVLSKTNLKMLSLKNNKIFNTNPPSTHHFPITIETLDVGENIAPLPWWYITFLRMDNRDIKLRELHASDQRFNYDAIKQILQEIPNGHNLGHFSSDHAHYKRLGRADGTLVPSQLSDNNGMAGSNVQNTSQNETVIFSPMDKTGFGNALNARLIDPCPVPEGNSNIMNICLPTYLEAIYARSSFYYDQPSVPHIRVLNNTVLSHVDLSGNVLKSWLGPIENVPSLRFLNLSKTHCENVDVHFFRYMVSLEVLIMSENYLFFSLADDVRGLTFSTLTNLKTLDLNHNTLQDLSRLAFIKNTKLETLDLSQNRLTEFQPTVSKIRKLSFLDLSLNLLPGLSEQTCQELKLLKSRNEIFTVNLLDNPLLFTCDYFPFLGFLVSNPHVFSSVEHLKFRYLNGTKIFYNDLAHQYPSFARECQIQSHFIVILIVFFIVVGTVTICAVIYHKRWKLRYLYYIGHRRMHIGEHVVDYVPAADVFITYDQDDLQWRRFMQQTFLPGLNQRNITYILGETDFPGGDVMAHITGAVVGTRKTVILLSVDIFDDHHREFEMNLAIMREMDTRSLKIVPIFVEEVNLALYPREIELFLRNQWQRCLCYNSEEFWDDFVNALRENN